MSIYIIIFLTLVAAAIVSVSQIAFKEAVGKKPLSISGVFGLALRSKKIWIGTAGYVLGLIVYLYVLSEAPLSVVYPLFASSFIFVLALSGVVLKEHVSSGRLLGVIVVVFGIVLIALSY